MLGEFWCVPQGANASASSIMGLKSVWIAEEATRGQIASSIVAVRATARDNVVLCSVGEQFFKARNF